VVVKNTRGIWNRMQCTLVHVCVCVFFSKEHVASISREVKEQATWSNQKMEAAKRLRH